MPARPPTSYGSPVLLYDGDCALCNRSVQFILDRDSRGAIHFASLASPVGRELLARHGVAPGLDSVVFVEDGRAYTRSAAVLRIVRRLGGAWPLLSIGALVPRFLRDRLYDFVAARRYRWFGRAEACRLLTPDVRHRFLDL